MNAAFKGPDPKHKPRGEKRYRRKVAGPKQWAAIRAEKLNDRACRLLEIDGFEPTDAEMAQELHHLVPRSLGGDDVADNLVGVCRKCHAAVEQRSPWHLTVLADSLTHEEEAYCERKLGVAWRERLFGAP